MPARAGMAHALSAVFVPALSPFIQPFVNTLPEKYQFILVLEAIGHTLSTLPSIPYSTDTVTTIVFLGTVGVHTFIWGPHTTFPSRDDECKDR